MFNTDPDSGPVLERIDIPLIQRDYAQGRETAKVAEIRNNFLAVLRDAVASADGAISLDFVYGELADGVLHPLDGQQRLTTLFLLHWYLASRAGTANLDAPWTKFSYATRPSAQRFCERLTASTPPQDIERLGDWVRDQAWYLFVWRHDPTIQSMLVMLDAIHHRFHDVDAPEAWARLVDPDRPSISFHLLPLPDMGSAEDLYIKMNSRGKPLTEFENFKAHFEKTITWSPRAEEFATKIDGAWSDVFWKFRGDDDLIDDEFLRYFEFVAEVCEWRDPELDTRASLRSLALRCDAVFGADNPEHGAHLDFLFTAFDVWVGRGVEETFARLFKTSATTDADNRTPLRLFFRDTNTNLFESCCRNYGDTRGGGNRAFTYGQSLALLAVIVYLAKETVEFPSRMRILRNLIEGSTTELRADRMQKLVSDTMDLIADGTLPQPGQGFAPAQIEDEEAKRAFSISHQTSLYAVHELEDHALLRGSIGAFDLDATSIVRRTEAFVALMDAPQTWLDATAGLLSLGEYQRARGRDPQSSESYQFGTHDARYDDAWRRLLTGGFRKDLAATRATLGELLDRLAGGPDEETVMTDIQTVFLAERQAAQHFDWRYYMVRYPAMRDGASGIYFAEGKLMGYGLCNLRGGVTQRNSYFRDPYLLTIWRELGEPAEIADPWFYGYEWYPRYMILERSGVGFRAVPTGFEISRPTTEGFDQSFSAVSGSIGLNEENIAAVDQVEVDGLFVDTENRIELGVGIMRKLLEKGL